MLARIAFRNLLRQKRRNLFLGAAIAIGMSILVMANSFAYGISDVLFNRILSYVAGNVSVSFAEGGNRMRQVFRDGERMKTLVRDAVPGLASLEEAVGMFARAIGNGRNDNVILVGMDVRREGTAEDSARLEENFRMIEGSYLDLRRRDIENPVLVGEEKARSLGVRLHDVIRVRFQDVNGQNQAARLTVVGIFKPANVFMNAPVFLDLGDVKRLTGYGPGDIGNLFLMLPQPKKNAVPMADSLHKALKPSLAKVVGRLTFGDRSAEAAALGFRVDSASLAGLASILPRFGSARPLTSRDVVVGEGLARALGLKAGDRGAFAYPSRDGTEALSHFNVTAVAPSLPSVPENALLLNDREFYGILHNAAGAAKKAGPGAAGLFIPDSAHVLHPFLGKEWVLLDRTATTEQFQKKFKDVPRLKTRATVVDVATMYETASMVVNLEYALNLITLVAVLILFFIIQVGVVNTLRMTIRERTREIGTMRSIGMQRRAVRNLFLLETSFLTLLASAAGVALGFAGMWLLRLNRFEVGTNPISMLLVEGRLHFKPDPLSIAAFFALILAIAAATAWLPARRAANLHPSEALRSYG